MIHFLCPKCQAKLSIKPEHAGRTAQCSRCSAPIRIPATSATMSAPTLTPSPNQPTLHAIPSASPSLAFAPFLFGASSLLLGLTAVPLALVFKVNLIGVLLAILGLLLGVAALVRSLINQGTRIGLAGVAVAACASALLSTLMLTRGPGGWLGAKEAQYAGGDSNSEEKRGGGNNDHAESVYDQKELEAELTAATVRELRSKLGNPDEMDHGGMVTDKLPPESQATWIYYRRTRNPRTGKPEDTRIIVWILDGHVTRLFFDSWSKKK